MKTINGTTSAWLSSCGRKDDPSNIENLTFSNCDMTGQGWIKVGNASVAVELLDDQSIINGQIDMLHEAERRVMAESEKKLTEIRGQIQSLLAIEYKPEVM